jgi:hypothetical protein
VVEIRSNGQFDLEDLRRDVWVISVENRSQAERKVPQLRPDQPVVLIGEMLSQGQFRAVEIRIKRALPLPQSGAPGQGNGMARSLQPKRPN